MTKTSRRSGHTTSFTYDLDGNKSWQSTTRTNAQTDQTETLLTQFFYDPDGHLVRTVAPDGSKSQTVYNSLGKVDHTVDGAGLVTGYVYDSLGELTQTVLPGGATTATTYDAGGERLTTTDAAGRVTGDEYDTLGRLIASGPASPASPVGPATPQCPGGTIHWLTDAQGHPLASQTSYNDDGSVQSEMDPLGHVTTFGYDTLGRKTTTTDPLGYVTRTAYDDNDRQGSATDALGRTTSYLYDADGRLETTTYADGSTSGVTYDALGRRQSATDQFGQLTSDAYDALGRLSSVTGPGGQTETFGYDALGEKTSQTDANGHATLFAYDLRGHLVWHKLPGGQTETFTYDGAGRLSTHTDFNATAHSPTGVVTQSDYDPVTGRLADQKNATPGSPSFGSRFVAYTYYPDGSRQSATRYSQPNQQGAVTTTDTYDALGRLASVQTTLPSGPLGTVSYAYDDAGNKASATANGLTTTDTYDPDNRLWQVIQNNTVLASYAYDKDGNRALLTRANGVTTGYIYDLENRLTDVRNSAGSSYHYTLRADGKRLSVTDASGTTTYTYDAGGRLTSESGPNASIAYHYDNVGNRTSRTVTASVNPAALPLGTTNYAYDADDRLTNQAYDANGNQLSVGSQLASYDWQNKLVGLGTSQNPTAAAAYLYDADGNRVGVATSGGTTTDLWDTSLDFPSVVAEFVGGSLSASYAYGDDLISQTRTGSTPSVSYYVFDGLGSVRALTNTGGSVTDTYLYDAFGDGLTESVTTQNPFLFDAQQYDAPTGDYYLRARYYDEGTGRFLSQDPFGGDDQDPVTLHRYLYASDDPADNVDPGGNISLSGTLASIGGALAIEAAEDPATINALQNVENEAPDIGQDASLIGERLSEALGQDGDEAVTFYHATTKAAAEAIRNNGIDLAKSRLDLDFGRGFYTSTKLQQVINYALRNSYDGGKFKDGYEILTFRVRLDDLSGLAGKVFSGADQEWEQFVLNGRLEKLQHAFDYVVGPLLRNPETFMEGTAAARSSGIQISWNTQQAAEFLFERLVK